MTYVLFMLCIPASLTISLSTEADLQISGPSKTSEVSFKDDDCNLLSKVPFTHAYQIQKFLSSTIKNISSEVGDTQK